MKDEYKMTDVWKMKLHELEYQLTLMKMDKKFTQEDIQDMKNIIADVKKEYAKALVQEKMEEKHGKNF